AGPDVEAAHQTLAVVVRFRRPTLEKRGSDQDDAVLGHRRCRVDSDLAGDEIDLLPFTEDDAFLQIDDAVLAERPNARARLRVQTDESIAGRHVHDPFVAAVGPVADAAARQLTGRRGGSRAFVLRMRPAELACR